MRKGNDLQKNAAEFLNQKEGFAGGGEYFVNQKNLGYFMGSVAAAINNVASSEKDGASIAANIVTTLLWAGTAHHPADYQALAALGSGLANEAVRRIASSITDNYAQWKEHFYELAYVRNPQTGDFEYLPGTHEFNAAAALIGGSVH